MIVLTRYPRPGAVKTRLAAELGAERAAQLHGEIASHCITQLLPIAATTALSLEVVYEGASAREMRSWLGSRVSTRPQSEGDLGARLQGAIEHAFAAGALRVIAVGSDCPDLDAARVRAALRLLDRSDVVLTPAHDGGYALIGLNRSLSPTSRRSLFEGVSWGTGAVLRQTLGKARSSGLSVTLTEALTDIDRPQDLHVWERILAEKTRIRERPRISVVVPTLDEHRTIATAVRLVLEQGADEVIVADGGSLDRTCENASAVGARVVSSESRGRSAQMNAGAREANGDVILFLHADTRLPNDFVERVRETLVRPGVVAGAFEFGIYSPLGVRDWLIDRVGRARCKLGGPPYGDQAIFLRASTFKGVGGFPQTPTMEDYAFVRRLRRLGRIALVPEVARTSARSWHEHGLLKATAANVAVIIGYRAGVSAERLSALRRAIASRGEESPQAPELSADAGS